MLCFFQPNCITFTERPPAHSSHFWSQPSVAAVDRFDCICHILLIIILWHMKTDIDTANFHWTWHSLNFSVWDIVFGLADTKSCLENVNNISKWTGEYGMFWVDCLCIFLGPIFVILPIVDQYWSSFGCLDWFSLSFSSSLTYYLILCHLLHVQPKRKDGEKVIYLVFQAKLFSRFSWLFPRHILHLLPTL